MYEVFESESARLLGAYPTQRDALAYAISFRKQNPHGIEVNVVWRSDNGARLLVFSDDQIVGAIQRSAGIILSSSASTAPTTGRAGEAATTAGVPSSLVPV